MGKGQGDLDVVEEVVVDAPPAAVWESLVDAEHRRHWWAYLELEAHMGGRFIERWAGPDGAEVMTSGSVIAFEPPRLVELRWADAGWPAATTVTISVDAAAVAAGTVVRVRQSGWENIPDGAVLAEQHREGWRMHMANLGRFVEGRARRR